MKFSPPTRVLRSLNEGRLKLNKFLTKIGGGLGVSFGSVVGEFIGKEVFCRQGGQKMGWVTCEITLTAVNYYHVHWA